MAYADETLNTYLDPRVQVYGRELTALSQTHAYTGAEAEDRKVGKWSGVQI